MPLERNIGRTHDGLAHVVEAMNHMPVMVVRKSDVCLEAGVGLDYGELEVVSTGIGHMDLKLGVTYETVQLMRHGGGEDRLVRPLDRCRQVVVLLGVVDPDETHALCPGVSIGGHRLSSPVKHILGIKWFHFCSTSSVKNSDVFCGAYV